MDKNYSTKNIKFKEYVDGVETELINVSFERLQKNNYSLNYMDYLEKNKKKYKKTIMTYRINDICNIIYGTRIVRKKNTEGKYDVYGGGNKTFTTTTYNREGYNIVLSRFGVSECCVRILNKQFYLNDSGMTIESKDTEILLNKYLGYYMIHNMEKIYELSRGTAQHNISMDKLKLIEIPVPSVKVQKELIDKYNDNKSIIKALKNQIQNLERESLDNLQGAIYEKTNHIIHVKKMK